MTPQQEARFYNYWIKNIPKAGKALYSHFTGPATSAAAGEAGAGAGASAFGEGGVGMTAGSWAAVAAPLIAAYMKYQAGSGRNEPIEKRRETIGAAKMFQSLLSGNTQADPYEFGLMPKAWKPGVEGALTYEADDTDKWGLSDLWHLMHNRGTGHSQATGNSGFTSDQIDRNLMGSTGLNAQDLAGKLGMQELPDWNNQSYDTWFRQNSTVEDPVGYIGDSNTAMYSKQMNQAEEERKRRAEAENYLGNVW